VPVARPWCAIERRAHMNRLHVEEKTTKRAPRPPY
jgi:hypothetical protein